MTCNDVTSSGGVNICNSLANSFHSVFVPSVKPPSLTIVQNDPPPAYISDMVITQMEIKK